MSPSTDQVQTQYPQVCCSKVVQDSCGRQRQERSAARAKQSQEIMEKLQ